jgi:hypothetical protein
MFKKIDPSKGKTVISKAVINDFIEHINLNRRFLSLKLEMFINLVNLPALNTATEPPIKRLAGSL